MKLDDLDRLEKAATAAPWKATPWITPGDGMCVEGSDRQFIGTIARPNEQRPEDNPPLVVALRNDARALIAIARAARAAAIAMRQQMEHGNPHYSADLVCAYLAMSDALESLEAEQ